MSAPSAAAPAAPTSGDAPALAPAAPPTSGTAPAPSWVFFADHGFRTAVQERDAIEAARLALTPHAVERRAKVRAGVDLLDVAPASAYLDAVRATGAKIRVTSRWLNAVSVVADEAQIAAIRALPFVTKIQAVAARPKGPRLVGPIVPVDVDRHKAPAPPNIKSLNYGDCFSQIHQIQVDQLHAAGYSGAGVIVCMLDTGFLRTHASLVNVHVIAEHDFVQGDSVTSNQDGDDPSQHSHGTATLSILAGYDPGHLIGPAYGASFALAKTETISSETPIEEDWWVAGAEWADSLGADVISSSLGYLDWYTYQDMDGNTAVTTIGADLAVANGICAVNAAGNEGANPWHYIIAPADGDSVITIGAVDSLGTISSFSSRGPTFDGRIKPDVCAMGQGDLFAIAGTPADYGRGSGTSFSTPLVAGVVTLLLQAHPSWTPVQVRQALRATATRAMFPGNDYGWGIVRGMSAAGYATGAPSLVAALRGAVLWASPNPSRDVTALRFALPEDVGPSAIDLYDVSGRRVQHLDIGDAASSGTASWDGRDSDGRAVPAGVYFARLRTPRGDVSTRLVRLQ
ncbi:MAG: S8 family serine peptidase [bacterium]